MTSFAGMQKRHGRSCGHCRQALHANGYYFSINFIIHFSLAKTTEAPMMQWCTHAHRTMLRFRTHSSKGWSHKHGTWIADVVHGFGNGKWKHLDESESAYLKLKCKSVAMRECVCVGNTPRNSCVDAHCDLYSRILHKSVRGCRMGAAVPWIRFIAEAAATTTECAW